MIEEETSRLPFRPNRTKRRPGTIPTVYRPKEGGDSSSSLSIGPIHPATDRRWRREREKRKGREGRREEERKEEERDCGEIFFLHP